MVAKPAQMFLMGASCDVGVNDRQILHADADAVEAWAIIAAPPPSRASLQPRHRLRRLPS